MSPESLAICLALFSAVTVAITNFTVKRGGDVLTARAVMSICMALTVLPFAPFVPLPPADMWKWLALAIVVHWFYQFCMIRSLHRGDLSLVFPVMRGLGPPIVAILAVFTLGEVLQPLGWVGLALATIALIVFAIPEKVEASTKSLNRAALIWAAMTAFGIGLYTVTDAFAIRQMPSPYTFIVWLILLDWIGVTSVTAWTRRGQIIDRVQPQLKASAIGGVTGTLSYGAALYAFTLTDAALVTALRETSVFFAALLGVVFLREGFGYRRGISAAVLAMGLVLMQIGGSA